MSEARNLTRPSAALGVLWLVVTLPLVGFGQSNPVPLVNQPLVPDAVAPGGSGFTLTVNGTGFVSGATVNWNGSPRTTTFVSGSQLTASINAADIATAATASITVANPSPGGGTSNTVFFPVATPITGVQFTVSSLETGNAEYGIAAGDLRGDGKLDLVACNWGADTVSVYLGNGDGTFQYSADYATGVEPLSALLADFNGDGKLDLAVTNYSDASASVSIFLGNGDGTFQPGVQFPAGGGPNEAFTADFNGDGKLDLAVTNLDPPFPSTVSILLGNGDGTFQAPVAYPTASSPQQVAAGDFNGDGILDLAVTCATTEANVVSILLGNGDGTFQPYEDYRAGLGPDGVVAADFNGDGALDLAVVDYGGGSVAILLGNGNGTFQSPVTYGTGLAPAGLAIGDFNGAGVLDLATDVPSDEAVFLLGNGNGTFQKQVHFATGDEPEGVAVGDFNGDGRLDVATANSGTISVLLENAAPGASLSETSLSFAPQLVNTTSSSQRVTLTNSGVQTLDISSIAVSGDFLESNTCGSTLAVSASCTITVQFRPAVAGTLTGAVTITDNAPESPQTISLSGSGTFFSLSPTSLSFGDVNKGQSSPPQTVTLTNFAKTSESVSVKISGANSGEFAETNSCGTSLAAGASCSISVTFTPKYAGSAGATLQVSGGGGGNLSVSLSGTGVS